VEKQAYFSQKIIFQGKRTAILSGCRVRFFSPDVYEVEKMRPPWASEFRPLDAGGSLFSAAGRSFIPFFPAFSPPCRLPCISFYVRLLFDPSIKRHHVVCPRFSFLDQGAPFLPLPTGESPPPPLLRLNGARLCLDSSALFLFLRSDTRWNSRFLVSFSTFGVFSVYYSPPFFFFDPAASASGILTAHIMVRRVFAFRPIRVSGTTSKGSPSF